MIYIYRIYRHCTDILVKMPQCQLVEKWLHDLVFIIPMFDNFATMLQCMRGSWRNLCFLPELSVSRYRNRSLLLPPSLPKGNKIRFVVWKLYLSSQSM